MEILSSNVVIAITMRLTLVLMLTVPARSQDEDIGSSVGKVLWDAGGTLLNFDADVIKAEAAVGIAAGGALLDLGGKALNSVVGTDDGKNSGAKNDLAEPTIGGSASDSPVEPVAGKSADGPVNPKAGGSASDSPTDSAGVRNFPGGSNNIVLFSDKKAPAPQRAAQSSYGQVIPCPYRIYQERPIPVCDSGDPDDIIELRTFSGDKYADLLDVVLLLFVGMYNPVE